MKKLIIDPYEIKFLAGLFMAFLILFLLIISVISFTLARSRAPREAFLGVLTYLVFAVIVMSILAFCLKKIREGPKKATLLAKQTIFERNRLIFPMELEFEYGRMELLSSPERMGSKKEFKVIERKKTSIFEFPDEDFKLVATYEKGFASFPAVKILTKAYERTVLLFMTNKGEVTVKKLIPSSILRSNMDVEIRGEEKELVRRLYKLPNQREKVEIFLSAPESPKTSVKIADSSAEEFRYSMVPNERIVIFSHYGSLSMENLLRTLNSSKIILGHGEFLVMFKLSKPKRGELASYKFKVELKEGEGWGV
ncbi:hypothetical protein E3E22_00545 [Thermococcus sp. MV5]|uniref:hypothetical protein n=1 Tax=Thermococcus sp. MV5 TaxID=1638272 RepID=UPI00143A8E1F|nr:hypothetical protein [Thermococcus sp. MV5]NJE25140.1 hypothetical protein [Thermococcus sp. MV5]